MYLLTKSDIEIAVHDATIYARHHIERWANGSLSDCDTKPGQNATISKISLEILDAKENTNEIYRSSS